MKRVKPWYKDGLRFECQQCAFCCRGEPGYVWMKEEEIVRAAEYLNMAVDAFGRRFLRQVWRRYSLLERADGDCVMLQDGRCSIYEVRPRQCQSYPFWKRVLKSLRTWQEEAKSCPGIGSGRKYSQEEIKQRVTKP